MRSVAILAAVAALSGCAGTAPARAVTTDARACVRAVTLYHHADGVAHGTLVLADGRERRVSDAFFTASDSVLGFRDVPPPESSLGAEFTVPVADVAALRSDRRRRFGLLFGTYAGGGAGVLGGWLLALASGEEETGRGFALIAGTALAGAVGGGVWASGQRESEECLVERR